MIWMLLLGAMPVDPVGDPLPRYLTSLEIVRKLAAVEKDLQGCGSKDDSTEGVSFSVHGDGSIQELVWAEDAQDAQLCWSRVLQEYRFPKHDDAPIRVETTVYVRDGVLTLSPQPKVFTRPLGPLMIFVLPENVGRAHHYLHEASDPQEER